MPAFSQAVATIQPVSVRFEREMLITRQKKPTQETGLRHPKRQLTIALLLFSFVATRALSQETAELQEIRQLANESLAPETNPGPVIQKLQLAVFDALRVALLKQFDPSTRDLESLEDVASYDHDTVTKPGDLEHTHFQSLMNALWSSRRDLGDVYRGEFDGSALNGPYAYVFWRQAYGEKSQRYKRETAAALRFLPRLTRSVAKERLRKRIGDAFGEAIEQIVRSGEADRTHITSVLGNLLLRDDTPSLGSFADVKPCLDALGIWDEVRDDLRFMMMHILATIRSPYAYFWIAKVVGETTKDGEETALAREACRLLSHDDHYVYQKVINGAEAAPYFTFEKWVGLKAASAIASYGEATQDRSYQRHSKLVSFIQHLEAAVFTNRQKRGLTTPATTQDSSLQATANESLKDLDIEAAAMRKILHAEHLLDSSVLTIFIANHSRLNLCRALSKLLGPGVSMAGRLQRIFGISPEAGIKHWLRDSISECSASFGPNS